MNAIKGTVKNRQVLVDVPEDWPEGCEVVVEPMAALRKGEDDEGLATPEQIAGQLALMDQLVPGWLSAEDNEAWQAALQEQKEYEKARFNLGNTIVVSKDSDLSAVPGLIVENWAMPQRSKDRLGCRTGASLGFSGPQKEWPASLLTNPSTSNGFKP